MDKAKLFNTLVLGCALAACLLTAIIAGSILIYENGVVQMVRAGANPLDASCAVYSEQYCMLRFVVH